MPARRGVLSGMVGRQGPGGLQQPAIQAGLVGASQCQAETVPPTRRGAGWARALTLAAAQGRGRPPPPHPWEGGAGGRDRPLGRSLPCSVCGRTFPSPVTAVQAPSRCWGKGLSVWALQLPAPQAPHHTEPRSPVGTEAPALAPSPAAHSPGLLLLLSTVPPFGHHHHGVLVYPQHTHFKNTSPLGLSVPVPMACWSPPSHRSSRPPCSDIQP